MEAGERDLLSLLEGCAEDEQDCLPACYIDKVRTNTEDEETQKLFLLLQYGG